MIETALLPFSLTNQICFMKNLLFFLLTLFIPGKTLVACTANFTWEQIPNTLNVHFHSTSTSEHAIVSYQWIFGDGNTGDGFDPYHLYASPGVYNVCLVITDEVGCVDDVCHEVVVAAVGNNCEADFTWEQLPNTLTEHFHSTSTSNHDIISYQWNFGDGNTGDGSNPYHTYAQPGVYNVCLIITDNAGCVSDICHEVVVEGNVGTCNAQFEWEQLAGTLIVDFFSTSTADHAITSYQWNFGDGQSGDGDSPSHTYAEAGVYVVCLIITTESGCVSDICHEVVVAPASGNCEAAFVWEQIPNTLNVHFHSTSYSQHDIISYMWNFGDGDTGDGFDPYHLYDAPGVYLVCLTITDEVGCVDDVCHEVVVEAVQPGECHAEFDWEQLPGTLTEHFHSLSTSNHDITSYFWNFGDGHTGDGQNPYHTYDQAGVYVVCLTITDNSGCSDTTCHEVVVNPVTPGECHADFTWEQLNGTLIEHFHSTSTSNHDIISYFWNFGDGHTGDGQNPYHTYEQPGTYLVCLTITDNSGCSDTTCHEVVVNPITPGECHANFTWEQLPNTLTEHFHSTSTSNHDIISYFWNFGDGHTGDGQNPYHTYEQPGVYLVCLTIVDNSGCSDTTCHEVVVEAVTNNCEASFTWEQTDTLTLHFNSTSTSNHDIISYMWTFGDGGTASTQDPYHTYDDAGVYLVCLVITDNAGCVSDVCHEVAVTSPAMFEANFGFEVTPSGGIFHFSNQSHGMTPNTTWYWTFGDGASSSEENPEHVYGTPGFYTVCLTMLDTLTGHIDMFCTKVLIGLEVTAYGHEHGQTHAPEPGISEEHFAGNVLEFRYTNPVKNELWLQYTLSGDMPVQLELYNMQGNRVMRQNLGLAGQGDHGTTVSTSALWPGLYAIHLVAGGQVVVRTVLITQ